MIVQHNLQAMNANRMLGTTKKSQAKATEKLSSGLQINRAADDAAGLSISEKMRRQIRGLDQAATNAQDGISSVQTAEGALTEVHSMLQRMNELAVQAANGTNSEADRQSIQDEIAQLTTEIDRVAETTKFNETYLLKGNGKEINLKISAKDAGIDGEILGSGTGTATFTMDALETGDKLSIGAKGYTIGTTIDKVKEAIDSQGDSGTININGKEYTIVATETEEDAANNKYTNAKLQSMIADADTVIVGTNTYVAMKDTDGTADGIGDNDASVISKTVAYELIRQELQKASSVGTDAGMSATVKITTAEADLLTATQISFQIEEGTVKAKQGLQIGLHVGADSTESNKIAFTIDTMDAAGLGIKNVNVVDSTGAKATYAIDAISDAISKVSAQRSTLGAIQNRLEHTIANLDNVVENTTAAESQIRDTDMAEMMVEFSKNSILEQAGQSMLAQANQSTAGVLSLLQ